MPTSIFTAQHEWRCLHANTRYCARLLSRWTILFYSKKQKCLLELSAFGKRKFPVSISYLCLWVSSTFRVGQMLFHFNWNCLHLFRSLLSFILKSFTSAFVHCIHYAQDNMMLILNKLLSWNLAQNLWPMYKSRAIFGASFEAIKGRLIHG